ncbi:hypothetical protein SPBR_05822 [Sporothrix brasiliensis 5110]|uniref:Uncharacterized protein n=1 Tax=Sporothrix brasiliensis 5110 TaxID=1398154 RepID=A0A0C2J6K4_9PEZI|nr:uncharacterized protein SPBR_05822 [Sporothrix brasiliensis 5110]KIH94605.1 hypothetical protein SPBR_05822 [Sporothrix brasiliensis 5110]
MTSKRLALKTQMSRDTLKTIFSVGSLETRSSSDLFSKAKDSMPSDSPVTSNRRNTFQGPSSLVSAAAAAVNPLKAVTKRKSRLTMTVDFTDEFEEALHAEEAQEHRDRSSNTATPEPLQESKVKTSRRSWLRWSREGDRRTPSPGKPSDDDASDQAADQEQGTNTTDESAFGAGRLRRTESRSSSIISRTMSLTSQLERSLSLKITFPKISMSRPSTSDRPAIPISAFSTAFNNSQALSPSLPSPLFAGVMEQQRRAMPPDTFAAASPPSASPSEAGCRRPSRQSSQDSLYNSASAQYYRVANLASATDYNDTSHITGTIVASPPPLDSPSHSNYPNLEAQFGQDYGNGVDRHRRGSLDSLPHAHRSVSLSGNDTHMAFVAAGGGMFNRHRRSDSQDSEPRVVRHRASFNGYSLGPSQSWNGDNYSISQSNRPRRNPPQMSNGYTGQVMDPFGGGHRRSGSASSGPIDFYKIQQQQAWDYYYQQYARPPPNVVRGSHHRNRSMGSRHGPVSGPQAPYRILHSYNSPAYRGVPIWG